MVFRSTRYVQSCINWFTNGSVPLNTMSHRQIRLVGALLQTVQDENVRVKSSKTHTQIQITRLDALFRFSSITTVNCVHSKSEGKTLIGGVIFSEQYNTSYIAIIQHVLAYISLIILLLHTTQVPRIHSIISIHEVSYGTFHSESCV